MSKSVSPANRIDCGEGLPKGLLDETLVVLGSELADAADQRQRRAGPRRRMVACLLVGTQLGRMRWINDSVGPVHRNEASPAC